jgi:hypothetical protein
MFDLKPYLMALMIVSAANVEEAGLFIEKLKEHSKQMMPIQFDIELTTIVKPRFNNMEDSLKYWTDRRNNSIGRYINKPSEIENKAIIDQNASNFVTGVTSTVYYKCKSFDSNNYLIKVFMGESKEHFQTILSDGEFQYEYDPEANNMAIMSPSMYTRERLILFEHERAYNFIDKRMKMEENEDDLYVYINMHDKWNYVMKFKRDNIGFPFEIVHNIEKGYTNYYYRDFKEINGIQIPTQIRSEYFGRHEMENKLFLKYVMIFTFSNIKIDKTMKKDDIDIMVPPNTKVNNISNGATYQLSNSSEKTVSVKKNIKR